MVNEGIMLVKEDMLVAEGVNGGLGISLKIAYHDVDIGQIGKSVYVCLW